LNKNAHKTTGNWSKFAIFFIFSMFRLILFVKSDRSNVFWSVFCLFFNVFLEKLQKYEKVWGFFMKFDTEIDCFSCLFLVSITFFSFFSPFVYELVFFFIQVSRTIMVLDVFCTFYWIWKKVWEFWEFFAFFWISIKNLVVFLQLFLISTTFFLCFHHFSMIEWFLSSMVEWSCYQLYFLDFFRVLKKKWSNFFQFLRLFSEFGKFSMNFDKKFVFFPVISRYEVFFSTLWSNFGT